MKKMALLLLLTLISGMGCTIIAMNNPFNPAMKKGGRPLMAEEYHKLVDYINGATSVDALVSLIGASYKDVNLNHYIVVHNDLLNNDQYVNAMEYVLRLPMDQQS